MPTPTPSPQPAAPDTAALPPVDWASESQKVAARIAANYGTPDTSSPPPNTHLPARLCAPRQVSEATQARMDELLPPPANPSPPVTSPPDSVMLSNNIRVGFIGFGIPLGKKTARRDSLDHMDERPKSSVPDPHTCD